MYRSGRATPASAMGLAARANRRIVAGAAAAGGAAAWTWAGACAGADVAGGVWLCARSAPSVGSERAASAARNNV